MAKRVTRCQTRSAPTGHGGVTDPLPEELLGEIFRAAGVEHGRSITRVSKRWRRAFFDEPSLWRRLTLAAPPLRLPAPPARSSDVESSSGDEMEGDEGERPGAAEGATAQWEAWFAAKRSLLRRVGARVRSLEVRGGESLQAAADRVYGGGWRALPACLAHLQPATLAEVSFECACPRALQALHRFTGLTRLELRGKMVGGADIAPRLPSLLGKLGKLQSLTLSGFPLSAGVLSAVLQLPQLAELSLESLLKPFSADFVCSLPTRLPGLRRLALHCGRHALPGGAMPALAQLPGLEALQLSSGQQALFSAEALAPLAEARRLRSIELQCPSRSGWHPLVQLRAVRRCLDAFPALALFSFDARRMDGLEPPASSSLQAYRYSLDASRRCTVRLHARNLGPLAEVLQHAVPAGATLAGLVLSGTLHWSRPPGTADPSLQPVLLGLTSLALPGCHFDTAGDGADGPDGVQAALPELLAHAPGLADLSIGRQLARGGRDYWVRQLSGERDCFELWPLPGALVRRAGLRRLALVQQQLEDLPTGPYLASVKELDLSHNRLARLPHALAGASRLQALVLDGNVALELSAADAAWLAAMPALRVLSLEGCPAPAPCALARLRAAAPLLEIRGPARDA